MKKNIAMTLIASKLAVSTTQVYADEGGLGKIDSSPGISLSEIGAPIDILTPPSNDGSKSGVLYTALAEHQRIDFIIDGIRHEGRELQVYLAYSKLSGRADQWLPFASGHGQIELDTNSLQLLAGITVQPSKTLANFPATPLGSVDLDKASIILPVSLSDLDRLGNDGDRIFFQAVVIPVGAGGELLWDLGSASEVDSFVIDRSHINNQEYDDLINDGKASGSTSSDDGGKTSEPEPIDNGGK